MLEKTLATLGVEGTEVRVYTTLLDQPGPITAGSLARQLGVARASLYGFLARLQEKGLVRQSMDNNVKTFYPERPEKVDLIFKNHIKQLEESRAAFKTLLSEVEKKAALLQHAPRFSFFEGKEGVRYILNDMLLQRGVETSSLWPIKEMMAILGPEFFHYHNIQRIQNNISVRALWPKGRVVNVKKYPFMGSGVGFLRQIRLVPEGVDCTMGYWIYKNKIAYLSSQREAFGFIVESAEMVKTAQAQFDFIWAHSKQVNAQSPETAAFLKTL